MKHDDGTDCVPAPPQQMAPTPEYDDVAAVLRVAKAIFLAFPDDGSPFHWDELDAPAKERYRALARAAIRAFLEVQ